MTLTACGDGAAFAPVEGEWQLAAFTAVEDGCGMAEDMTGDEPSNATLTLSDDGTSFTIEDSMTTTTTYYTTSIGNISTLFPPSTT